MHSNLEIPAGGDMHRWVAVISIIILQFIIAFMHFAAQVSSSIDTIHGWTLPKVLQCCMQTDHVAFLGSGVVFGVGGR
jgi:hypothetical protein